MRTYAHAADSVGGAGEPGIVHDLAPCVHCRPEGTGTVARSAGEPPARVTETETYTETETEPDRQATIMGLFKKKPTVDPVDFLALRAELQDVKARLDASEQAKAYLEARLGSLDATRRA